MSSTSTEVTCEKQKCNMSIKCETESDIKDLKTAESVIAVVRNPINEDGSHKVSENLQETNENAVNPEKGDLVETIINSLEDMSCKNVETQSPQEVSKTSAEIVSADPVLNELNSISSTDCVAKGNEAKISTSTESEALAQDMSTLGIAEPNNKFHSGVILNQQTDSLKNLMFYESSDDESDDSDFETNWQLHMLNDTESAESSEDGETDLCPVYINKHPEKERGNNKEIDKNNKNIKNHKEHSALYSLEELDRFNLPPLPDLSNLTIDYDNEEFLHIGHVKAIVESLVTIEAIPGSPSYDLDTILFVDDQTLKKPLGAIYDVIGPVASPIYCVRMKNEDEVQDRGVKLNMKVYSAPKSKYTQYVFVAELRKLKGTDASWLEDKEMPHGADDSSGDELTSEPDPPILKRKRDSLERHQRFEKTMNRCNSLHTRVARLMDHHRVTRGSPVISNLTTNPDVIPAFNPAVPPPTYVDLRTPPPFPVPVPMPHAFQIFQNQRQNVPQMWQPQDSRIQRPQLNRLPNHNYNHNWNHHAGPSRGHGQY